MTHIPVLEKEVIEWLNPQLNENFIDATFGEGGHSLAILNNNKPNGRVLGIELDPVLYQEIKLRMARNPKSEILNPKRLILVNDSYVNLKEVVKKYDFKPVNGILFDLGVSSWHFEKSGRGFTFRTNEPLDMRFNPEKQTLTAKEILNKWKEEEIEKILRELGEEKFSREIAREIVSLRKKQPIETTYQLVEIIKRIIPFKKTKLNLATKTFMALRISVNQEIKNLPGSLETALEVISNKGRMVTISFHSLEDRICKNFFKQKEKEGKIKILTKKAIKPDDLEIQKNKKARSAKLRVAIKLI